MSAPKNLSGVDGMPETYVDQQGNQVPAYDVIAEAFGASGIATQKAWNEVDAATRAGWIDGVIKSRSLVVPAPVPEDGKPDEPPAADAEPSGAQETATDSLGDGIGVLGGLHPTEAMVEFFKRFESCVTATQLGENPFLRSILQNYRQTRPSLKQRHQALAERAAARGRRV